MNDYLVSTPTDVDVELGDFVYDEKAEEERDVDVTIKYKDSNGLISTFIGIEVKKHKRPLDVTHVEQLIKKLSDMGSITQGGIVSTSGYTKSAIKKAQADGIALFQLRSWPDPANTFEHIAFVDDLPFDEWRLEWVGAPTIHFNPTEQVSPEEVGLLHNDIRVCDSDGNVLPDCPDLKTLKNKIIGQIIESEKGNVNRSPDQALAISKHFNIVEEAYLDLNSRLLRVKQARVSGHLIWKVTTHKLDFKMLVKEGESKPYIGCGVAELSNGELVGFTASTFDRSLHLIRILVSERNKEKLHRLKLR